MVDFKTFTGKVLYGLLFMIVLPFLLIWWSIHLENIVQITCPLGVGSGMILSITGLLFMGTAMFQLWKQGKGLPMNAYPPQKLVTGGVYAFMKHPVYFGAILISFGISALFQSKSGFWLVSPLFVLMIVVYVVGFENERTIQIFGDKPYITLLSLVPASDELPSYKDKLVAFVITMVPWFIIYEAFIYIGLSHDAIYTNLSMERTWPVWEYSELVYAFTYVFVGVAPFLIFTKSDLRDFVIDVWFALFVVSVFYLAFPFVVYQRTFEPASFPGRLILLERSSDGVTAALPSFHVIWAFLVAGYYGRNSIRLRLFWYVVAVLISISCITTGNHSVPDVIAGIGFYVIIRYRLAIWNAIRSGAEKIANSWKEWRFGPIRIINHGLYGGAAGFAGMWIVGSILGKSLVFAGFLVGIAGIAGAGLWAQFIEGSPRLLRPYGYYGAVSGVVIACLIVCPLFHLSFFLLLGAFALAGPWIQILGRLRCLVQGCCHGKQTAENLGIRFTHPYSRVNKIAGLTGKPLHPTQLYSIGVNFISGLFLFRLMHLGMTAGFITGIYFLLNGLGRFVEEAYRGEPQTPYWAGMRIYQWIALINIVIGGILTAIPCSVSLQFSLNLSSLLWALAMGIIATIAYGVDFPESNRRFARLTTS